MMASNYQTLHIITPGKLLREKVLYNLGHSPGRENHRMIENYMRTIEWYALVRTLKII